MVKPRDFVSAAAVHRDVAQGAGASSSWIAAALRRVGDYFFAPATPDQADCVADSRGAVTTEPRKHGGGTQSGGLLNAARTLDAVFAESGEDVKED